MIKLKRDICMLETTVNKFSWENEAHVDLKIETRGDEIGEEIEYKAITITSVQRKALKSQGENLK